MLVNNSFKFLFGLSISLFLFLVTPISGQVNPQRVEQYYVTKDGVKTRIVEEAFSLDSENSKFLFDKVDLGKKESRYDKLKEAMKATYELSGLIDTVQRLNQSDGAFSIEQAKRNLELLKKEKELDSESTLNSTLEELVFLRKKFGDKPSFFINGTEVSQQIVNKVLDKDILDKQVVVQNTITGNPNGEIRYFVSDRTFKRLGLSDGDDIDNIRVPGEPLNEKNEDISESTHLVSEGVLLSKQNEIDALARRIKELENRSTGIKSSTPQAITNDPETKIVSNTGQALRNTQKRQEVVHRYGEVPNRNPDSVKLKSQPKERVEEEVFVVRKSDWKEVKDQDDKPKRSIRDIKERDKIR